MSEKKELTLEEQLKAAQDENIKLAADLKTAGDAGAAKDEIIKALNEELVKKETEVESLARRPLIKVGKGKSQEVYELRIAKFVHNFKGERLEVDKAVLDSNPELVDELIRIGSNALIKKGGK